MQQQRKYTNIKHDDYQEPITEAQAMEYLDYLINQVGGHTHNETCFMGLRAVIQVAADNGLLNSLYFK